MLLSKLEIKGFKSFGDKITIHFDRGVTGIVGPNGCGKSNVVDAIRWVLGEQKTRNLRSDKMENLIFNGTRTRKPLQMAEVALTFLNNKNILPTEYTTVTISRRYYRDSESEYLLNGVACRLKDITGLFLDTGIGPDSYAIIELKMVDDILSDRENSRRALLEEAAGISKFKIRKKETFRKLEETEADLNRLEDVLFEIRKNMKSLEKQAKQAEEYYQIKENYRQASIEHAKLTMAARAEDMAEIKQKLQQSQGERAELSTRIAQNEADLEEIKRKLLIEEKTLSSRQKTLNDYVEKIREIESQKKIREDRFRFYTDRQKKMIEESNETTAKKEILQKQIKELDIKKINEEKQLHFLSEDLELSQESLTYAREESEKLRAQLDIKQINIRKKQQELYRIEKNIEFSETQKTDLENELKKAVVATEDQTIFLENFERKLESIKKTISEKTNQILNLEKIEIELAENIILKSKIGENLKESLTDIYRKLDARQNELNLTRAMVENLEGFPEAVKFLRKNKSWSKKAPLLADLINIEEKYKVALESVLEPYLNHYVVQTENEAYLAMKLLSEGQKGKSSFFILDRLSKLIPQKPIELEDALPAKKLLEYDPIYENLVSYLLEDVYITDKPIPFGAHSATETPVLFGELTWDWADHTVVSISGAMTRRKFSISGGSTSVFEGNKIGKGIQMKKLEAEIGELNTLIHNEKLALEENQEEINCLRESTQKSLIDHLQKEVNQLRQEEAALSARKEQSLQLLSSSKERKEDILKKINQLSQNFATQLPVLEETKTLVEKLEIEIEALQKQWKLRSEETAMASGKFNQLNIQSIQLQNGLKARKQEEEFRQQELNQLDIKILQIETEKKNVQIELDSLSSAEASVDSELPGLYEEKQAIESGLNESERIYFETRGNIDNQAKEIRDLAKKRELIGVLVSECQETINAGQAQLISIQERINVEFETQLNWEENMPPPNANEEEKWRQKAQSVKNQLDRIGPINLMAREAYQEIKERHDFIEGQKNDLLEARNSLTNTIGEIEKVARTHFSETFQKIQENFKKVFRSLFTDEDTCDLVLHNPDEPLESPIDIMARPKGKRPLTINQLSGGEKTLTAISLLFAIYLIKPAPFCIFDEADAPLDDTNIDKFNRIIRKFSKESQFIIVTHNKRTMASTDVIYGVTMPEQGVSRVIPVDLRELA
jgi:chromosome segregation protein